MAFSLGNNAKVTPTSALTTRTISVPAGVADGDAILLFTCAASGAAAYTVSGLSGLTLLAQSQFTTHTGQVYVKSGALASDAGTTITVATSSAYRTTIGIIVLKGVAATSVVDAYAVAAHVPPITTSSVGTPTSVQAGDIELQLILWTGNAALTAWTAPGGFTKIFESLDAGTAGASGFALGYSATPLAAGISAGGDSWVASASGATSGWTILIKTPVASDTVRPVSLVSNGGAWTNVGGAADIPAALADESDITYVESADNPTGAEFTVAMALLTSGQVAVSYKARVTGGTGSIVSTLKQGATTIASWTDSLTTSFATYTHITTAPEAAAITDYGDLRVTSSGTAS